MAVHYPTGRSATPIKWLSLAADVALRPRRYAHRRVNHSQRIYVSGTVHTNTIEGFWSLVKRGISGSHHAVSAKYLQSYLDEYVFRYNNRDTAMYRGVFGAFLSRIPLADQPS